MITKIFLMIIITFLFVAFSMPFVKKIAYHIGALDVPRDEEGHRHIHEKTTPKLGGLAIFFGFLFSYMIFGEPSALMNSILIGSFIIIITGIIDDINSIKARSKFVGQLAAAAVVTFYGGLLLQDLSAFGFYIDFGILAYPITLFFIVACVNCINLIEVQDPNAIKAIASETSMEEMILIVRRGFERKKVSFDEAIRFMRNSTRDLFAIKFLKDKMVNKYRY